MADFLLALAIWPIATLRPLAVLFFSLPPPLQGAVLTALGGMWLYRRGWNNAVDAVWVADVTKANETRRARRK